MKVAATVAATAIVADAQRTSQQQKNEIVTLRKFESAVTSVKQSELTDEAAATSCKGTGTTSVAKLSTAEQTIQKLSPLVRLALLDKVRAAQQANGENPLANESTDCALAVAIASFNEDAISGFMTAIESGIDDGSIAVSDESLKDEVPKEVLDCKGEFTRSEFSEKNGCVNGNVIDVFTISQEATIGGLTCAHHERQENHIPCPEKMPAVCTAVLELKGEWMNLDIATGALSASSSCKAGVQLQYYLGAGETVCQENEFSTETNRCVNLVAEAKRFLMHERKEAAKEILGDKFAAWEAEYNDHMCCKAMTAQCLSCEKGITVDAFCAKLGPEASENFNCQASEPSSTAVPAVEPAEKSSADKYPQCARPGVFRVQKCGIGCQGIFSEGDGVCEVKENFDDEKVVVDKELFERAGRLLQKEERWNQQQLEKDGEFGGKDGEFGGKDGEFGGRKGEFGEKDGEWEMDGELEKDGEWEKDGEFGERKGSKNGEFGERKGSKNGEWENEWSKEDKEHTRGSERGEKGSKGMEKKHYQYGKQVAKVFEVKVAPVEGTMCPRPRRMGDRKGKGEHEKKGAWEKDGEFGEKKGEFGDRKGEFGERKGEFGEKKGEFGEKKGEFGDRKGEFGERKGEFGEKKGEFGEKKGEFGEKKGEFDERKGEFGERKGEFGGKKDHHGGKKDQHRESDRFDEESAYELLRVRNSVTSTLAEMMKREIASVDESLLTKSSVEQIQENKPLWTALQTLAKNVWVEAEAVGSNKPLTTDVDVDAAMEHLASLLNNAAPVLAHHDFKTPIRTAVTGLRNRLEGWFKHEEEEMAALTAFKEEIGHEVKTVLGEKGVSEDQFAKAQALFMEWVRNLEGQVSENSKLQEKVAKLEAMMAEIVGKDGVNMKDVFVTMNGKPSAEAENLVKNVVDNMAKKGDDFIGDLLEEGADNKAMVHKMKQMKGKSSVKVHKKAIHSDEVNLKLGEKKRLLQLQHTLKKFVEAQRIAMAKKVIDAKLITEDAAVQQATLLIAKGYGAKNHHKKLGEKRDHKLDDMKHHMEWEKDDDFMMEEKDDAMEFGPMEFFEEDMEFEEDKSEHPLGIMFDMLMDGIDMKFEEMNGFEAEAMLTENVTDDQWKADFMEAYDLGAQSGMDKGYEKGQDGRHGAKNEGKDESRKNGGKQGGKNGGRKNGGKNGESRKGGDKQMLGKFMQTTEGKESTKDYDAYKPYLGNDEEKESYAGMFEAEKGGKKGGEWAQSWMDEGRNMFSEHLELNKELYGSELKLLAEAERIYWETVKTSGEETVTEAATVALTTDVKRAFESLTTDSERLALLRTYFFPKMAGKIASEREKQSEKVEHEKVEHEKVDKKSPAAVGDKIYFYEMCKVASGEHDGSKRFSSLKDAFGGKWGKSKMSLAQKRWRRNMMKMFGGCTSEECIAQWNARVADGLALSTLVSQEMQVPKEDACVDKLMDNESLLNVQKAGLVNAINKNRRLQGIETVLQESQIQAYFTDDCADCLPCVEESEDTTNVASSSAGLEAGPNDAASRLNKGKTGVASAVSSDSNKDDKLAAAGKDVGSWRGDSKDESLSDSKLAAAGKDVESWTGDSKDESDSKLDGDKLTYQTAGKDAAAKAGWRMLKFIRNLQETVTVTPTVAFNSEFASQDEVNQAASRMGSGSTFATDLKQAVNDATRQAVVVENGSSQESVQAVKSVQQVSPQTYDLSQFQSEMSKLNSEMTALENRVDGLGENVQENSAAIEQLQDKGNAAVARTVSVIVGTLVMWLFV